MELLSLKIIILTLSGLVRLVFGLIPMVVMKCLSRKFREGTFKTIVSFLMFFGGGVLLATCFLHMMPEVRHSFEEALPGNDFPIAEVIFIGGFFVVYILEDMVHNIVDHRRSRKRKLQEDQSSIEGSRMSFEANINGAYQSAGDITYAAGIGKGSVDTNPVCYPGDGRGMSAGESRPVGGVHVLPRIKSMDVGSAVMGKNLKNKIEGGQHQMTIQEQLGHFGEERFSYVDPDWWRDTVIANSQMNLLSNSTLSVASANVTDHGGKYKNNNMNRSHHGGGGGYETGDSTVNSSTHHHKHHGHHHGGHSHSHIPIQDSNEDSIGGSIRNLLIVIAISFHGIFEGLAIGLQNTEKDVWYLFLAVSLHECTILFCIGVELISSKTKVLRMITYILVVSMVSPVGIAIGIVISEKSFASPVTHALVIGSLQGLAAGTLLYVTFFEIFASEGKELKIKSLHILVAVLGFVVMASLELLGGHSHGGHGAGSSLGNETKHDHSHTHHPPGLHHSHSGEEDDHHSHEHVH